VKSNFAKIRKIGQHLPVQMPIRDSRLKEVSQIALQSNVKLTVNQMYGYPVERVGIVIQAARPDYVFATTFRKE
jgi:hypothetical protein